MQVCKRKILKTREPQLRNLTLAPREEMKEEEKKSSVKSPPSLSSRFGFQWCSLSWGAWSVSAPLAVFVWNTELKSASSASLYLCLCRLSPHMSQLSSSCISLLLLQPRVLWKPAVCLLSPGWTFFLPLPPPSASLWLCKSQISAGIAVSCSTSWPLWLHTSFLL